MDIDKLAAKRILIEWGRDVLVFIVNQSRHKNNQNLIKFIKEELSDEQVLNALFKKEIILEYRSTMQSIDNAKNVQSVISVFASIPLSRLFFGNIWQKLYSNIPLVSTLLGSSSVASFLVGGIVFGKIFSLIQSLINKLITEKIAKTTDKCAVVCRQQVKKSDALHKWVLPLCQSQCRVKELQETIVYLKKERLRCKSTEKPEACEHAILSQIIRCQKILEDEMRHLQKVKQKYDDKKRTSMISATKMLPEKPKGI